MSDPLKTALRAPRVLLAAGAIALGFGLFAASAQAGPVTASALGGLKSPGLDVQTVAAKRYRNSRRAYLNQYYVPDNFPSRPNYAKEPYMPYGGSDEILELQRRFPETNWPPSMRYF
jgi:hypothetical protein